MNTGHLQDRETKGLLRVAPGGIGMVTNVSWRTGLEKVLRLVKDARVTYKRAKDDDLIVELANRIEIRDWQVAQELDKIRGDAVRELNIVLKDAGLNGVDSPL